MRPIRREVDEPQKRIATTALRQVEPVAFDKIKKSSATLAE
jgi:hypothetical protein